MFAAELRGIEEIGLIPYSSRSGEPVLLLWKESKAIVSDIQSSAYYSCLLAKKCDDEQDWKETISSVIVNVFQKIEKVEARVKKFAKLFPDSQFPFVFVPVPFRTEIPSEAIWIPMNQVMDAVQSQNTCIEGVELYLSLIGALYRNMNQLCEFTDRLRNEQKLNVQIVSTASPEKSNESNSSSQKISPLKKDSYRCRKCRKFIFADTDLEQLHEPGTGQTAFAWRKRNPNQSKVSCSGYFLTSEIAQQLWRELSASADYSGEMSGKLDCPHCSARIGSFNWTGAQCSCGCWIAPAFKISHDKVEH